jgi:DNA recombination-dependent growth factor C
VSSPNLEEEMVALLLPRSFSELPAKREWYALRNRLLLLAGKGGAEDADCCGEDAGGTEPVTGPRKETLPTKP